MTDVPISKISFLFFVLLSCIVFFSCSDSDPELSDARGFVVFDYSSESALPVVKLAAFAEATSEIQRVESISVKSRSTGYLWTTYNPVLLTDDRKKWAGYSDFITPAGMEIPTGLYDLTYTDALDNEVSKTFAIFYNNKLVKAKAEDAVKILSGNQLEFICVYSAKGTLLYYGPRKSGWTEDKKIFATIKDSESFRICYMEPDKSVYCLMPAILKTIEK